MAELGTEAMVKPPQESEGPSFPPRAVEQSATGCARPPAAFAAHLSACGRCFRHVFSISLSLLPPNSPSENTLPPQPNQPCSCSFGFQPSCLLTCPSSSPHPSHAGVSKWRTWDTVCAWFYSELPLSFPVSSHLSLQPKLDQETSSWSKKAERDTDISALG